MSTYKPIPEPRFHISLVLIFEAYQTLHADKKYVEQYDF